MTILQADSDGPLVDADQLGNSQNALGIAAGCDAELDAGHLQQQAEFMSWFAAEVWACPVAAAHPEVSQLAIDAVARWRLRLSRSTWRRLVRGVSQQGQMRLLKELLESIPLLAYAIRQVEALPVSAGKVSIADLCSGVGYLGMFLSELLPPERVAAIVLFDKAWPVHNQEAVSDGQMNPHHIQDIAAGWPIPITIRKVDLKKSGQRQQIHSRFCEAAPGPVLILAVHLCGQLSLHAVELFNDAPKVVALALKPCCLPGSGLFGRSWTLGGHSFQASDVVSRGRYRVYEWVDGPPKGHLANKYQLWAKHLFSSIDVGISGDKSEKRYPLREGGWHYQELYIFAERPMNEGGDGGVAWRTREHEQALASASAMAVKAESEVRRLLDVLELPEAERTAVKIFGVSADAGAAELKVAFKTLAHLIHPEEFGVNLPGAQQAFDFLRAAYVSARSSTSLAENSEVAVTCTDGRDGCRLLRS